MKITAVEALLLRGDQTYSATADTGEATDNGDQQVLLRVATDEGLVGWSDIETLPSAAHACVHGPGLGVLGFRSFQELLIGQNPLDVEQLWETMFVGSSYYGRRGVALHCLSAVDNCLWSIRAQAAGVPLHQLLGTRRVDRLTAYASTLFRPTPEGMEQAVKSYIERGFQAVKFGWGVFGEDPVRDRELVAAARETLGPKRQLMVDPGWYGAGWQGPWRPRTIDENIALCQWLSDFDVRWIEDFIHPEKFEEYQRVRESSPVPIAAGEQLGTFWEFRRFIEMGCVDVVQPDLTRCGGMSEARRIAVLAQQQSLRVVPHAWLTDLLTAYSLQFACTLAEPLFVEFNVAQSRLTRGVCGGVLQLNEDGTVSVPDGIGLGVNVDESFVRRHTVRYA